MKSILSFALIVFATLLFADAIPSSKGKFNSDKLIQFEDHLDYLEFHFAAALAKGGDSTYEAMLSEFDELALLLQKEVVKADLLDFIDVRDQVNAISDTYHCLKDSLAKGRSIPLVKLVSTRRHNRAEGNGAAENWASFKCTANLDEYYAPYDDLESKGYSKVSPYDLIDAIIKLRRMIGWMERDGSWNIVANNGREFVLREPPPIEVATSPADPAKNAQPKRLKTKF